MISEPRDTPLRVSHECWEHGGLFKMWWGGLSQYKGSSGGGGPYNDVEKYLWRGSFVGKVAGSKPETLKNLLKINFFTSLHIFFKDFCKILSF